MSDTPSMPANVAAEKSVLGAILLNNESYLDAAEILKPEDFVLDSHRKIYSRMVRLIENNRVVDHITLAEELECHHEFDAVGGYAYLSALLDGVPERPSIANYVQIVRDKAMLRRVIHGCRATLARAFDQREEALVIMADAEDMLARIAGRPRNEALALKDLLPTVLNDMALERKRTAEYIGIPTGIKNLDRMLGGIRDSELWIAGGMPGYGKTSFGIQMAMHAVQQGFHTVDFSLEMKNWQVVRRILAGYTCAEAVGSRDAKTLSEARWNQVLEEAVQLATLPLFVDESSSLTLRELRAKIKLYKKKFNIRLAVVDYIRLLQATGKDTRERVTNIALGLANIAKEENVCILALSQLSRPSDLNHVPNMTDLKESGDLEASAHVVLLLYRPLDERDQFTGEDAIIVGKAREGPRSAVAVVYDEATLLFKPRIV